MIDRCRINILDDKDHISTTIDVDPIYAEEAINEQRVHSVSTSVITNTKISVSQTLLHQRLGHRHTSTLVMADEDIIWADTKIAKDDDRFL
jgi:hypothetical protein